MKALAIDSWSAYKAYLTEDNWKLLNENLHDNKTYEELLNISTCFLCVNNQTDVVGMAFFVQSGNPTDIYLSDWCYIRFVSVHPKFGGKGIGRELAKMCIDLAKQNGEKTIALHTSEMMHAARHIYESMGFAILKEIDKRLGVRYWLYTLDLPANKGTD